jgi:hypothetical protein
MQLEYSSPIFCSLAERGGFFQNLPQVQPVQLQKLSKAAIPRFVGGQRVALEPAVATESVKVLAGVDRLVDQRGVEDPQCRPGGGLGRRRGRSASRRGGLSARGSSQQSGNEDCNRQDRTAIRCNGKAEHAETLADSPCGFARLS